MKNILFLLFLISFPLHIMGSEYYWNNEVGPGSQYYWNNEVGPGSQYYWNNEVGPGSQYYWNNEVGPSIITSYPLPLNISIAISKSIGIF